MDPTTLALPEPTLDGAVRTLTRLRVLTGRHVGAHLDLPDGMYRIGADLDCDVALSDWSFEPLTLALAGESATVSWSQAVEGAAPQPAEPAPADAGAPAAPAVQPVRHQQRMADFRPREFDGIVLCLGPVDRPWPADVALLDAVFQPTPQRVVKWAGARLRRRPALWASAAVALCSGAALALSWPAGEAARQAAAPPSLETVQADLQAALDRITEGRLRVATDQSSLAVSGMLDSQAQAGTVRQAIEAHRGPYTARQRTALAPEVAETIRNAVGMPGATVQHLGDGVFRFDAESPDVPATRAAVERVAADLAPAVRRIDAHIERLAATGPAKPILSQLTADGVSVVQTRDGVKHVVLTPLVAARNTPSRPSLPLDPTTKE
jgi:type III secretion protein D